MTSLGEILSLIFVVHSKKEFLPKSIPNYGIDVYNRIIINVVDYVNRGCQVSKRGIENLITYIDFWEKHFCIPYRGSYFWYPPLCHFLIKNWHRGQTGKTKSFFLNCTKNHSSESLAVKTICFTQLLLKFKIRGF